MKRMSIQQSLKALRCYMMEDYGGCYREELEEFYEQYAKK